MGWLLKLLGARAEHILSFLEKCSIIYFACLDIFDGLAIEPLELFSIFPDTM